MSWARYEHMFGMRQSSRSVTTVTTPSTEISLLIRLTPGHLPILTNNNLSVSLVTTRVVTTTQADILVSYSQAKRPDSLLQHPTLLNKINMVNARVYVSGTNLITFANTDIDPEVTVNGSYSYGMPALRSVSFGLEVSF